MIGSGSNTYISVPTLDCIRLVGFSMPQWKNNLRRDASSSVGFEKKKEPARFASLNGRTLLFQISPPSFTLRLASF